jgi:hypothetical protein
MDGGNDGENIHGNKALQGACLCLRAEKASVKSPNGREPRSALVFAASGKHGSVWREQRLRRGKPEAGESDGRRTELDEAVLNLSGWIFLGAGLGGVLRFLCSTMVARAFGETFPWGTLWSTSPARS